MATFNDNVRLISSVVQFLKDELTSSDTTPDKAESLEVAIQCLRLAYDIEEEIISEEQPKLIDIFTKAVPPPVSATEEEKKKAESLKEDGNEHMKKENYEEAVKSYTNAIQLNSTNAVYYCNRAASYTGLGNHDAALSDCRKALSIDSQYSKAYSRMGLTYSKMKKYDLAVECYEKALKLDPNNEGYKKNLEIAKEHMKESTATPAVDGMAGLGGMAGMLNNPMLMNMAQKLMSDPGMQQMAMNMMGNLMGQPAAPNGAAETETAGAAAPDMSQILQMGQQFAQTLSQENPELISQLKGELNKETDKDDSES